MKKILLVLLVLAIVVMAGWQLYIRITDSDIGNKPLELEVKTYDMDLESVPISVKKDISGSISLKLKDGSDARPVFVLDGEKVLGGIEDLDPDNIENISVIKDMSTEASELFKVLGVHTRVAIIELLKAHGPMGVNSLAEILNITPAAVSQHLKVIKQAGLITPQRKGYWIPYSIDEEALENCRCLLNDVCACGCHGTGDWKQQEINDSTLEDLKNYEKELQNELERVQRRIHQR